MGRGGRGRHPRPAPGVRRCAGPRSAAPPASVDLLARARVG